MMTMNFPTTFNPTEYTAVGNNKASAVADWLCDNFQFFSLKKGETLYIWNEKYYETEIKHEIFTVIERMYRVAMWRYSLAQAKEVMGIIINRQTIDGTKINKYPTIIPFKNGWYNIRTKTLETPTPDKYITYTIPWNYNPDALCPRFRKFMKEIVPKITDRRLLYMYSAYTLLPSIHLQKALMLYGRGHNGKTVYTEVMDNILGDLASHIMLQELGSRFNKAVYMGKLANVADDIPHKALQEDSFFKMLTTNKTISGEIKGKQPFDYYNICHNICTCNEIPTPAFTASDGFYRRWIIIALLESFVDSNEMDLEETLYNETEGIITLFIKWIPLINNLRKINVDENKNKWHLYGNSVEQFFIHRIKETPTVFIETNKLYNIYKDWCRVKGLNMASAEWFGKGLSKKGITKQRKKIAEISTPVYVYNNIMVIRGN